MHKSNHSPKIVALLIRLGCIPPDTEFNRRAQAYAREAENIARNRAHQRKLRKAKHDPHHGAEVCEETSGEECGTDSAAKV
jgi:hypothetical protein